MNNSYFCFATNSHHSYCKIRYREIHFSIGYGKRDVQLLSQLLPVFMWALSLSHSQVCKSWAVKRVCSETWNQTRLTWTGIWFYVGKSGQVHLESCEGSWTLEMSKDPALSKPSQTFSSTFKQLHIWEQRSCKTNGFDRKSIRERPGGFNNV